MKTLFTWRHGVLESDLPATTKLVLLTLACHMNDVGGSCFPSIERLMHETSLSKPTVINHLKLAKKLGWIQSGIHGFSGQKWRSNEYKIGSLHPEGGKTALPASVKKVVNLTTEGGKPNREGGKPNSKKAGKEVYPSTSMSTSKSTSYSTTANQDSNNQNYTTEKTRQSIIHAADNRFAEFWKLYPVHRDKKKAQQIWNRQKLGSIADTIINDVKNRKHCDALWHKGYIPHPTTYLRNDRWEDEYTHTDQDGSEQFLNESIKLIGD